MKLLLIIIFTLLSFTVLNNQDLYSVCTETIYILKYNQGLSGYDEVYESHNKQDNHYTHILSCSDPGTLECAWCNEPSEYGILLNPGVPYQDLVDYAEEQIDLNNLEGTYYNNIYFEDIYWYRTVTWDATTTSSSEIEVTVTESP